MLRRESYRWLWSLDKDWHVTQTKTLVAIASAVVLSWVHSPRW